MTESQRVPDGSRRLAEYKAGMLARSAQERAHLVAVFQGRKPPRKKHKGRRR